jgi:hypothetical protein
MIVPAPQKLDIRSDLASLEPLRIQRGTIAQAPTPVADQSFTITIDSGGASVVAGGEAGERYALEAIRQVRSQFGARPPAMHVEDWPAIPTRGLLLDVSRTRVPTMRFLTDLLETMALLRLNHLQLYTEHAFAYEGHEAVWRDASPIMPDEARTLDDLAVRLGIELTPNQNCFGHMERWLRHDAYAPFADIQGDVAWPFGEHMKHGPFSLCPIDPASLGLVRDLLGQLLPCFRSPLVNIGCDETHDVGYGRSRAEVEQRGRAEVYLDFVERVAEIVRLQGKRPMFWADIVLSDPDAVRRIPADAIALAWGYEPDTPFDRWCEMLRSAGIDFWVCPGTSSWRSITGRTTERRANVSSAIMAAIRHGASGVLITDWGDLGHHQQWPISLHAISDAASHAWNPAARPDPLAVARHVFRIDADGLSPWLDELGDLDLSIRQPGDDAIDRPIRNSTALFNELHGISRHGDISAWRAVGDCLDSLISRKPGNLPGLIGREIDLTLSVARAAVDKAVLDRSDRPDAEALRLERAIWSIMDEHASLWHERSRPGGLAESLSYYEAAIHRLPRTREQALP